MTHDYATIKLKIRNPLPFINVWNMQNSRPSTKSIFPDYRTKEISFRPVSTSSPKS
jgi:hypothetical protein